MYQCLAQVPFVLRILGARPSRGLPRIPELRCGLRNHTLDHMLLKFYYLTRGKPSYEGDIHSLGVTILEVLAGSIPYSDMNVAEALIRVTQGQAPERPLEQVPNGSKQADAIWLLLVQNCWALEPNDRISAVDLHYKGHPRRGRVVW
ncbi:hypothetical protein RSOLAG1IB_12565 [Rhizoctonia solani AG-1 IB]|uniref:Serine-threonine/tyrosine-protein kinase catalytic domain-containing protein n=1 Tax=Thanatephorus cucumeris (strain AG1-IB / isolate 7/3/14) TaxID=1108050 RepID=A0A0B7G1S6_THACB|nr:hypothetical protein RSOLAG1IB_12565 [Rhizoctonia solani AG-1 IB]